MKEENIFTINNYYKPGIFEKLNFLIQKKIKKHLAESKNPFDKALKEITNDEKIIKTLTHFYNQDGSFKKVKIIIKNKEEIDKNIINNIISNKVFMKSINIKELKSEEIKYMIHALEQTYQEELLKLEELKQDKNPNEEKIHNEKKLTKKLKKILSLRSILMNMLLNKKSIEEDISLYDYIRKRKSI